MTASISGSGCVLRLRNGENSSEFDLVEGCRVTRWKATQEEVDVTTAADGGWRTLLAEGGIRSIQVSVAGIYLGSPGETRLREAALSGRIVHGEMTLEPGRKIAGPFLIAALSMDGQINEEATYEAVLQSAGCISIS